MKVLLSLCFIGALVIATVDGQENKSCNFLQSTCETGFYCFRPGTSLFGICLPYIPLGGFCSANLPFKCSPEYECRAVNDRNTWLKTCQYPATTAFPPTEPIYQR